MVRDDRTLDMIHRLKYARELHLARDLGRLAAESFADPRLAPALEESWPLVPVPLMVKTRYGRIVNISSGLGQMHQMAEGSPAYRVSKAALNALTVTLAAELADSGILVNSMSPGWVRTDMGGASAPRSVEEGAETAVWLSLLPSSGPTGQFFRDRNPIPW